MTLEKKLSESLESKLERERQRDREGGGGGGGVLRLCSKKQTPRKNTKSQRQSGAML